MTKMIMRRMKTALVAAQIGLVATARRKTTLNRIGMIVLDTRIAVAATAMKKMMR
jgi:hypothetical protein